MKRAILFLAIGVILAAVTFCVAAASPGPADNSSEIEQLRNEVAALRLRVESLEKRLQDNQASLLLRGRLPHAPTPDSNDLLQPRSTPKDWRRFEFNGMPYYVIPIDARTCPGPEPQK